MLLLILCIITGCNQLLFKETIYQIIYPDGDTFIYIQL